MHDHAYALYMAAQLRWCVPACAQPLDPRPSPHLGRLPIAPVEGQHQPLVLLAHGLQVSGGCPIAYVRLDAPHQALSHLGLRTQAGRGS